MYVESLVVPIDFGVFGDFILTILYDLKVGVALSLSIDLFEADLRGDVTGGGNHAF